MKQVMRTVKLDWYQIAMIRELLQGHAADYAMSDDPVDQDILVDVIEVAKLFAEAEAKARRIEHNQIEG